VTDCTLLVDNDELKVCTFGAAAMEDRLLASLVKSADGPVSRHLNRKISTAVTRRLMNTPVHPNHVTFVIMVIGIASGIVASLGGYWAGVIGATLLQLQSILDGTDGELSRLRFQGSKTGEWLDTIGDDVSNVSFLVGAAWASATAWVTTVGLLAGAVFTATQLIIYYILATVYKSGNLQSFQWQVDNSWGGPWTKIEFLFKRDTFCLMFLALALLGLLDIAVVTFAVGIFITATTLIRRGLR